MTTSAVLQSRGSSERGGALVLVLVMTSVCLIIMLGILGWVTANARLTHRQCQFSRLNAAAEAATEKVLTAISTDYKNQGQGYVLTNLNHYRDMYPTAAEDPVWANYSFMDVSGRSNRTYVGYTASTNFTVLSAEFKGLRGFANTVQIISNARELNSTMTAVGAVQQQIQLSVIPLFQYAMFYNLDYECNALPVMTVSGPVHCNATIYLTPVTGLTFNSDVTACVNLLYAPKNGNPIPNANGPVTFKVPPSVGVSALTLPIGTNNSPAAVRQVVEMPAAGESPLSSIGLQRYYNKADLIILVKDTNVVVSSGLADNFATAIPWLQATNFMRTNINFTNQREGKTIKTTEINIAGLSQWNQTNALRSVISGGDIRTIYVADLRTQSASTEPGVRLINGQTLLPQGLTVASPDPVYIQGNYNCPTAALGTTNTSGTLPASIAADAITVLSTTWDDSKSSGSFSTRLAGDTTVNAALLAGIVQTSPAVGYSGGVENFPRFLEEWTGKTLTYNGSMVVMFDSRYAVGAWNNIGIYYNPPTRNWAFDNNFSDPTKLPPDTPAATIVARGLWRLAQPYSTNAVFTF